MRICCSGAQVTVGLRHAALLTRSGEAYTWGSGSGGKLGLGHSVDACSPQRVHTLWGQRVRSIVAGGQSSTIAPDTL
jgi:alpha-tubulin suppressor-like RCC1 family protein